MAVGRVQLLKVEDWGRSCSNVYVRGYSAFLTKASSTDLSSSYVWCLLGLLQQTDTPYGTPYGSFSGGSYSSLSSMQTPPHSLSGYSPMTHLHGLPSSYHSTPGRSGAHAGSMQVLAQQLH